MPNVSVVIPAGGSGTRMGGSLPKQFHRLGRMSILERSIRAFHGLRGIREIILVVPPPFLEKTRAMVAAKNLRKVRQIVEGGEERQDSVRLGLMACAPGTEIVLVHDAVRPFITRELIVLVVAAAELHGAAVPGIRVKDTIKCEEPEQPGFYVRTLTREGLWGVQTPQGFRYGLLLEAHDEARKAGFKGTDDASLVERLGIPVRIVEGEERNLKITTPEDMEFARHLLRGK
jgi:2-C-methyl-D-erythritol 4-phosphate cytidylyltransferase